jgi:hypothetical protein
MWRQADGRAHSLSHLLGALYFAVSRGDAEPAVPSPSRPPFGRPSHCPPFAPSSRRCVLHRPLPHFSLFPPLAQAPPSSVIFLPPPPPSAQNAASGTALYLFVLRFASASAISLNAPGDLGLPSHQSCVSVYILHPLPLPCLGPHPPPCPATPPSPHLRHTSIPRTLSFGPSVVQFHGQSLPCTPLPHHPLQV